MRKRAWRFAKRIWRVWGVADELIGAWEKMPRIAKVVVMVAWPVFSGTILGLAARGSGWVAGNYETIIIGIIGGVVIGAATVIAAVIISRHRLALPEGYRLVEQEAEVHRKRTVSGNQPAATGTVTVSEPVHAPQDEPAMRVETRGFESFPLHPKGYGWLIPSVTITNPTNEKMTVDAALVIDGRRLPAARDQELVETKARPPRSKESRLPVPVDVPERDVVHGSLMFVMTAAAYENLPSEIRSTLSLATKVLDVKDLLSGAVERIKLGPENQTIIAQFPKLPQPSRWHRFKRKLATFWNWLRD